jgi:hypothetical protein
LQLAIPQEPDAHVEVAFGRLQEPPHTPQLVLVFSSVSHPVLSSPSQSPRPEAQELMWHAPEVHTGVAKANVHTLPHVPQFWVLVSKEASQPVALLPSQSP